MVLILNRLPMVKFQICYLAERNEWILFKTNTESRLSLFRYCYLVKILFCNLSSYISAPEKSLNIE